MKSINGLVICKPYQGTRKLESQVKSGFATVKQKTSVIGLETLVSFSFPELEVPKGSTIYVSEEILFGQYGMNKVMECSDIEGPFIIVNLSHILFIKD
jgi:hypothetical protein